MKQTRRIETGALALACLLGLLLPRPSRAGTLSTDVIGLFPKEVGEFAYADLKTARKFKWFSALEQQMVPGRFRQFEQFLASAGIDPNTQVDELAWGSVAATATHGDEIVGVALGQFSPSTAEEFFKKQKLPARQVHGYNLYAFGSGAGPADIFFFFLDSNTAAFGQREVLENLIGVRFGEQEGLLASDKLFPLINEANGRGIVWAVLNQGYTRLGMQQLLPEAAQFPEANNLLQRVQAMLISVETSSDIETSFQAVCASPDDANTLGALLQAGILYRRYQATQTNPNPDLAQMLDSARILPRGDRLEVRLALTEDQLTTLLRRNTFAVKM